MIEIHSSYSPPNTHDYAGYGIVVGQPEAIAGSVIQPGEARKTEDWDENGFLTIEDIPYATLELIQIDNQLYELSVKTSPEELAPGEFIFDPYLKVAIAKRGV